MSPREPGRVDAHYDAVVVGAGFSGLYMLHRLRALGFAVRVFEQGGDVGGTWYWNRYPGARCDVDSVQYSYSFSRELEQDWDWSERYAGQPEILKLCPARRGPVRPAAAHRIQHACRGRRLRGSTVWRVTLDSGKCIAARHLIMAIGCLSNARTPDFEGLDRFTGRSYHTGAWPHEGVDFTGLRVGVIGTGSSGIQSIPVIAEQAEHVTVFQRTPNYSIPARNQPLDRRGSALVEGELSGDAPPRARGDAQRHRDGIPTRARSTTARNNAPRATRAAGRAAASRS